MKVADLPPKQAKRYLQALQAYEPHQQLLIKVGGGLLQDKVAVGELTEALQELGRRGVRALIVHGGGPQLTTALKQFAVAPQFIGGKRYTDEATLKLAKTTFQGLSEELVQTFATAGVKTTTIPAQELFTARQAPKLGLVGTEITKIDTAAIQEALQKHTVLVVHSLARNESGDGTLNVNADTIFKALATKLKPHRMVSLTPTGGVLKPIDGSDDHEMISGINIQDIESLIEDGIVSGGMALKLRELGSVLDGLDVGAAISITKPSELLLELLTDQGSGTFVCKGQKIIKTRRLDDLLPDFSALISEAFGRSLPKNYEDQTFKRVYFTGDHQAFGIVTKLPDGTPYLDKLAVSPEQQGRGVGESLWYCIAKDQPVLVWRSHVDNRYATWYHRHADIMKRHDDWILFGRGIEFEKLEALEQAILAVPQMR